MVIIKNQRLSQVRSTPSWLSRRKGWIKIIEAFIAILLIAAVALIVVEKGSLQREDIFSGIQNTELSILREIQLNETLRNDFVGESGEVEWESFPELTKSKIESKTPSYLECQAKLCEPDTDCFFTGQQDKDIYAKSALISSSLDNFNPLILKLFCWMKES